MVKPVGIKKYQCNGLHIIKVASSMFILSSILLIATTKINYHALKY